MKLRIVTDIKFIKSNLKIKNIHNMIIRILSFTHRKVPDVQPTVENRKLGSNADIDNCRY